MTPEQLLSPWGLLRVAACGFLLYYTISAIFWLADKLKELLPALPRLLLALLRFTSEFLGAVGAIFVVASGGLIVVAAVTLIVVGLCLAVVRVALWGFGF